MPRPQTAPIFHTGTAHYHSVTLETAIDEMKQAATSLAKFDHHCPQQGLKRALVIPLTRSVSPFFCLPSEVSVPKEVQDQADTSSLLPRVYCFRVRRR
jgi:hypothetical protein